MDSGWAQALIAGGAAEVAIIAAALSARQAREAREQAAQARRQADAAHGDVAPTFHIEQIIEGTRAENCSVVCRNFNRHALRMHEIRINHPKDIILIPASATVRDAIDRAIIELATTKEGQCVVKLKTTLPGVSPGQQPSEYRLGLRVSAAARVSSVSPYAVQFYQIEAGRIVDMIYEIDFELLGSGDVSQTVSRPAAIRF